MTGVIRYRVFLVSISDRLCGDFVDFTRVVVVVVGSLWKSSARPTEPITAASLDSSRSRRARRTPSAREQRVLRVTEAELRSCRLIR